MTPRGRHLHGTCIPPGCTYPESFVSLRPSVRRFCPASIVLLRVHAAARGTCHVARGATRPTPSSFRRFGASFGVCPVRIGPSVRLLLTKVLGQTYPLTNRPAGIWIRPPSPEEISIRRMDYVHSPQFDFELGARRILIALGFKIVFYDNPKF